VQIAGLSVVDERLYEIIEERREVE